MLGAGAIGGCSDQQPSLVSELAEHPVVVGAADFGESVVVGAADLGEAVVVGAADVGESVVVGAAQVGRGFVNLLLLDGGGRAGQRGIGASYTGPCIGWGFPTYISFGQ